MRKRTTIGIWPSVWKGLLAYRAAYFKAWSKDLNTSEAINRLLFDILKRDGFVPENEGQEVK